MEPVVAPIVLSPTLAFSFVLDLVRGLEVACMKREGLVLPADHTGTISDLPASVTAWAIIHYR